MTKKEKRERDFNEGMELISRRYVMNSFVELWKLKQLGIEEGREELIEENENWIKGRNTDLSEIEKKCLYFIILRNNIDEYIRKVIVELMNSIKLMEPRTWNKESFKRYLKEEDYNKKKVLYILRLEKLMLRYLGLYYLKSREVNYGD